MSGLISVIVPVYKVEPYLRQCVDSILNQTYRNLEIILVDDGSPDKCGAICDEYAAQDSRVQVIHKENGGLSDARNAGLRVMTGEWLMFVDSDDWMPTDGIKKLLEMGSEHDADLVIGAAKRVVGNGDDTLPESGKCTALVLDQNAAMRYFFTQGCASWGRLYRADVHKEILFPTGEINEDEAIVLRILERCSKVLVTDDIVYFYRLRDESITTTAFSKKKLIWQAHCRDNLAFIQAKHPELTLYAAARYRGSLLWSLREIALSDDWQAYRDETAQLMRELWTKKTLFSEAPFTFRRDKIRYRVLLHCGFGLYRMALRLKRGK